MGQTTGAVTGRGEESWGYRTAGKIIGKKKTSTSVKFYMLAAVVFHLVVVGSMTSGCVSFQRAVLSLCESSSSRL